MAIITVGCKLPNGLLAEVGDKQIKFNGTHSSAIIHGHGITDDVPKDFWEAWLAKHEGWFEPLKKGLIFAHGQERSIRAEAKEKIDTKTGLEGLPQDKPVAGIDKAN